MEALLSICSPADAYGAISELYKRFIEAPAEIDARAKYLLERTEDFQRQRGSSGNHQLYDNINRSLSSQIDPIRHLILPRSEDSSHVSRKYRDAIKRITGNVTDNFKKGLNKERILSGLREFRADRNDDILMDICISSMDTRNMLMGIEAGMEIVQRLNTCKRENLKEIARRLFSNQTVYLDPWYPYKGEGSFHRIFHPHRNYQLLQHPAIPNANLLKGVNLTRFYILLDVTSALVEGKKYQWHHRHLSTRNIYIRDELLYPTKDLSDENQLHSHYEKYYPFAVVLDFRCPLSSCCPGQCYESQKHKKVNNMKRLHRESSTTFSFSAHTDHSMKDEDIDASSLASFLLWLYSGCKLEIQNSSSSSSFEINGLEHVPWELRFIVTNAMEGNYTPVEEVFLFLNNVKSRYINNPFDISKHVMSPIEEENEEDPQNGSNPNNEEAPSEEIISEAVLHSAHVGTITKHPHAAYFLGSECERMHFDNRLNSSPSSITSTVYSMTSTVHRVVGPSRSFSPSSSASSISEHCVSTGQQRWNAEDAPLSIQGDEACSSNIDHLILAYKCYAAAAYMGFGPAYIRMAYLIAAWMSNSIPRPCGVPIDISMSHIFRLLLAAIVLKDNQAYLILNRITADTFKRPVDAFTSPFNPLESSEVEKMETKEKVKIIALKIGKMWRQGSHGLNANLFESLQWLSIAEEFPEALIEIALLKIQWRRSAEDIQEAYQTMETLARGSGSISRRANFWIAYWSFYGLTWSSTRGSETKITVKQKAESKRDRNIALMHAEKASIDNEIVSALELQVKIKHILSPTSDTSSLLKYAKERGGMMYTTERAQELEQQACSVYTSICDELKHWPEKRKLVRKERTIKDKFHNLKEDRLFQLANKVSELLSSALGLWKASTVNCTTFSRRPEPPLMGAKMIMERRDMWADCCSNVLQELKSRDTFIVELKQEAFLLLCKAVDMKNDRNWQSLRVDFYHEDMTIMKEAERKMEDWFEWNFPNKPKRNN